MLRRFISKGFHFFPLLSFLVPPPVFHCSCFPFPSTGSVVVVLYHLLPPKCWFVASGNPGKLTRSPESRPVLKSTRAIFSAAFGWGGGCWDRKRRNESGKRRSGRSYEEGAALCTTMLQERLRAVFSRSSVCGRARPRPACNYTEKTLVHILRPLNCIPSHNEMVGLTKPATLWNQMKRERLLLKEWIFFF